MKWAEELEKDGRAVISRKKYGPCVGYLNTKSMKSIGGGKQWSLNKVISGAVVPKSGYNEVE